MEATVPSLGTLLPQLGPWIILAATFAETAFLTGLLVPAGVMTAMGAFLAAEGQLKLWSVLLASATGGAIGDSVGYWLGRRGRRSLTAGSGLPSRLARRHWDRAAGLFRRQPLFAITLARLVSFVRTLMPVMAGSSELSYPRFLAFELPGAVGYAVGYVAIGYLAGESWEQVSRAVGTGWAALFAAAAAGIWISAWWKRRS